MDKTNIYNRVFILMVLFVIVAVLIFGKLINLQIINHKDYTIRALEQINKVEIINSARGKILDSNGNNLAINESAATVTVNTTALGEGDKEQVIQILSDELGITKSRLARMLDTDGDVKVAQWVPRDMANNIRARSLPGVSIVDGVRRYYSDRSLSHVLGFTNIDNIGQYGIESSYNKELMGIPGRVYKSSDGVNEQIPTGDRETFTAIDGQSLVLTIDEQIQKYAYEESIKIIEEFEADGVQIIVQEIKTGDILAMSTYPSYDNNDPREPLDSLQSRIWRDREQMEKGWYQNWTNPIISHNYEPGSTFKLITAALAIEQNTSNPNEQYYCTGYIRDIKNAPILRCVSYEDPHGDITLKEALAVSCNPTFVYTARDLGKGPFLSGMRSFGFGEKTGIDLPGESIGIIPSTPEDISDLNLATMSYGHGVAVTPIQLINAVSAIGNDGMLMTPRIAKEMISVDGTRTTLNPVSEKRQVISKSTSETMRDMMVYTVEEGTSSKAKSHSYTVGGKTGTANKPSPDGGYIEGEYISSFVGMAPMEDPEITVLVVVDNPKGETYGSLVAAPHAKNIIEKTLDYRGVDITVEQSEDTLIEVPDIRYNILGDGGAALTELGLKYSTDYTDLTEATVITRQRPRPGDMVKPGSIVELTVDNNTGDRLIVPDLTGLTLEKAVSIMDILDLELEITGTGIIQDQEPKAGKKVRKDQRISVELSIDDEIHGDQNTEYRDDIPGEMEDIDSYLEEESDD